MNKPFRPRFTITNPMTAAITQIERARGFLEAAQLSDDWVREMGERALLNYRPAFYEAFQAVRENDMDLTVWLDYFVTRLETQMVEVKHRGQIVIRRDVPAQKHHLNERQGKAVGHLMQHGKLTIQDFEALRPEVNRRSLQRDLKAMLDKGLLITEGATNLLVYLLKD